MPHIIVRPPPAPVWNSPYPRILKQIEAECLPGPKRIRWEKWRNWRLMTFIRKNNPSIYRDIQQLPPQNRDAILENFWEALIANRANHAHFAEQRYYPIAERDAYYRYGTGAKPLLFLPKSSNT